ncbi:MAG: YwiC-like family protein [Chloroflexi bacterium]|nr:YwiC-like family protein [Chloroflexota bacterium]MCC6892960.1 YwiC-like family protein [Anaerolineae bacterium]
MAFSSSSPNRRAIMKSVALPSEHGGWGFLLEPILLGLLVAGTINGVLLALAAFSAFLIHQPFKVAIKDRLKGRRPPRTVWAERFTVGYGLAAGALLLVVALNADRTFFIPLLMALPLLLIQVYFDARNQSRELLPEIGGALALGSIAPAIALLGGWTLEAALVLWVLLACRSVPSILYVRERLKLEHDKPISPYPSLVAHIAAVVVSILLAVSDAAPWLAVLVCGLLLVRSVVGLSRFRKPRQAKHIGMMEMGYGLVTVILIALGYGRGW